jgi:hypothetical protein
MKARGFLADTVQGTEGKLSALGAGWNRLSAPGFPARHDRIGLALILTFDGTEDGQHNVEMQLLDSRELPTTLFTGPDGTEQHAITVGIEVQPPQDGFTEVSVPLALNLDGLVFPEPGTYAFAVRVDGQDVERLPFRVDVASADGPTGLTSSGPPGSTAGYL